ncbi:MAG: GNAT family N-acetyltransferase [Opitutales bacterium]
MTELLETSHEPSYPAIEGRTFAAGSYRLVPLREEDMESIRQWRNAQRDILRQDHHLSEGQQRVYYRDAVRPTFGVLKPPQMLFSFLLNEDCIGYGGLTRIDWQSQRAELSFLLATERARNGPVYRTEMLAFLKLIQAVCFEGVGLHRLSTETYDCRPLHMGLLEEAGFRLEGRLRAHQRIGRDWVDSLLHARLKEEYVQGRT